MIDIPEKNLKPQFIPLKCPVCNGFGTVNYGKQQCKACEGLGYVKVPPKEGEEHGHINR